MLRWIIGASLQLRVLVVVVAVIALGIGVSQLRNLPVDVLPEFSQPYVEIQTEAPGLSAPEVEALITVPLEADMLNGTPWVDQMRSQSITGLSSITLFFEPGTDVMRARQMVMERLTQVYTLPNVGKAPVLLNPVSSAGRVMMIGLTSENMSLIDMSVLARWTIVPRLSGINGVANVSIWGERRRQLQVQVDPKRLKENDIALQQVINSAGNALWFSPLTFLTASTPGASGFIDTPNQRLGVRHLLPISTPEEFAKITIDGSEKRLGDVATVVEDHPLLIGDAIVNDQPSLVLVVEKLPWANTRAVTRGVEGALDALRPGLAGLHMDSTLFRPATYLESAFGNVRMAILIGAALLVVVLGALVLDARATLISTAAILAAYVAAALVLYLSGVVLNAMVLAGLALAIVFVVDDAVGDVQNCVRRMREHRQSTGSKSFARIVMDSSLELRGPMLYASTILLLIAVPTFFIGGVTGAFLQAIAIGYGAAILASMFVAMTVTVALSVLLLPKSPLVAGQSTILAQLQHGFASILSRIVENPRPAFLATCLAAVAAATILFSLDRNSLLPTLKESDVLVELESAPGTSHPAMNRLASQATRELRAIPGVRTVSAQVGRAVMSDRVDDVNRGQLWVSIDRDAHYQSTLDRIHQVVAGYSGLDVDARTYFTACVTDPEREVYGDSDEDIVVRLYGDDWDVLKSKGEEVKKALASIKGIDHPELELAAEEPQVEIKVNMDAAKVHGLKPGDVRRAAATLVSGIEVGYLFEDQKVFDVVVWGIPEIRDSVTKIENLLIDAPGGGQVALKDVASVQIIPSPSIIKREAVSRHLDVGAMVKGRDVASVARDVERRLLDVEFPLEYRAELLGSSASRLEARNRAAGSIVAAAVGIFLVLQAFIGCWSLAIVTFVTLPAALLGGALAAMALGSTLSLGVLLGLVAVLGLAVRNVVSMIRHYHSLSRPAEVDEDGAGARPTLDSRARLEADAQKNGGIFVPGEVQRGTWDRFSPIVVTAIVSAAAICPLAFMRDFAGAEILHPMAIVILGGLVSCTLFSLMAVPATFLLYSSGRGPELEDLTSSLVEEDELSETIAAPRNGEIESQSAHVNN